MRAHEFDEDFKKFLEKIHPKNAAALVKSGRFGKKETKAHKALHPPGTNYSKLPNRKKYGKVGANDGFFGGEE